MKRRAPSILFLAAVAAILLASGAVRAQSINASGQVNPERLINGVDVGQSTRPVNLNPTGINYSDCIQDMVLQYSVTLSGFPGANSDNMQVWASNNGDCTADTARGIGNGSIAATCWLVNQGLTQPNLQSVSTQQFKIPVRALVGPQTGTIPKAGTLVGDQGPDACRTQTSFAATSITVWFLPLQANGSLDPNGTPYSAPVIKADLVGPPAPPLNPIADGDTLFVVSWTPNVDADTVGYDIFIDPPPGSGAVADAGFTPPARTLYCPDTGAPAASTTTGSADAALDGDAASEEASTDATAVDGSTDAEATSSVAPAATVDSGCIYINQASSATATGNSACTSLVLTTGSLQIDASTTVAATTTVDDAGNVVDVDSGVVEMGTGGISTIPCQYLIGATCPAASLAYTNTGNPTVTGEPNATYTIRGLTNGVTYDVVVAAVDGSGNVGPPSTCVFDYPAPVNDFFKIYRQDGGQAGGSFCALEAVGEPTGLPVVGLAFGAAAFTLARRRKRDRL